MKRCLSVDNVNDDNKESFVTALSKKARKLKKASINASQPSTVSKTNGQSSTTVNIEEIINSVVNDSHNVTLDNVNSTHCDFCSCACKELKRQLANQQLIITNVISRLNFLSSMFSIEELSISTLSPAQHSNVEVFTNGTINATAGPVDQWPALSTQQLTKTNVGEGSVLTNYNQAVQTDQSLANHSTQQTYSNVTSLNIQPQNSLKQLSQFRQSLVAAVYIDQRVRDSRASSFIISGLPISAVRSDNSIVSELCSNEFNIQVDIANTKRLGKSSSSPSSAIIQPLLVNVRNTDHAKLIISSARQLRRSSVPLIRDNVFINPNLTKAEASAAYEMRCRHREAVNRRSTAGQPATVQTAQSSVADGTSNVGCHVNVSASTLNAAVPTFVSLASTSSSHP